MNKYSNRPLCSQCMKVCRLLFECWVEEHPYGSTVAHESGINLIGSSCCEAYVYILKEGFTHFDDFYNEDLIEISSTNNGIARAIKIIGK